MPAGSTGGPKRRWCRCCAFFARHGTLWCLAKEGLGLAAKAPIVQCRLKLQGERTAEAPMRRHDRQAAGVLAAAASKVASAPSVPRIS